MKNAIAYIRASTQKQGKSGLGLEAQPRPREAVRARETSVDATAKRST
jgi:hypothetical protein